MGLPLAGAARAVAHREGAESRALAVLRARAGDRPAEAARWHEGAGVEEQVVVAGSAGEPARDLPAIVRVALAAVALCVGHGGKTDVGEFAERGIGAEAVLGMRHAGRELVLAAVG